MRPFPFVLRALTGLSASSASRPQPSPDTSKTGFQSALGGAGPDIEAALRGLEMERMESMIRRYRGRPPRIENPFAAFPTRGMWLGHLMRGD